MNNGEFVVGIDFMGSPADTPATPTDTLLPAEETPTDTLLPAEETPTDTLLPAEETPTDTLPSEEVEDQVGDDEEVVEEIEDEAYFILGEKGETVNVWVEGRLSFSVACGTTTMLTPFQAEMLRNMGKIK